jgi:hypothetical protein
VLKDDSSVDAAGDNSSAQAHGERARREEAVRSRLRHHRDLKGSLSRRDRTRTAAAAAVRALDATWCGMTDTFKNGPLGDLRVIELGTLLAGPFCGQLLGDMGAEVIKVEPPEQGDPLRVWGREKTDGKSLWWPVVARNKKSITLDLRQPKVRRCCTSWSRRPIFLLENFRPGTLEKWAAATTSSRRSIRG